MSNENRSIRLGRVSKESGLSISSIVNALTTNNIIIENNPNAKINEKEYEFLLNYFRIKNKNASIAKTRSTISFVNFRRFQNFKPIEYSGITFLVGRNNAGKSTLVKALLLIDNYFKSGQFVSFSFGNNILEDANIVTYGRAKNQQAKENFIQFTHKIENYLIELILTGDDDKAYANVQSLTITDIVNKINFIFNIANKFIVIKKVRGLQVYKAADEYISKIQIEINDINQQLKATELRKAGKEYIELVSRLEKLHKKIADVYKEVQDPNQDIIEFKLEGDFISDQSLTVMVENLLNHSILQYERELKNVQNEEPVSKQFSHLKALREADLTSVGSSFNHFMTLMNDFSIAYMGANLAKQSALFAIRDKNNALAQAIHDYRQLNILEGEEEHRFVLKWMQEFEVGDDFTISMHAGEAYEMRILSNNVKIHLADKGMGSIQAMLLIMRIACVIKKIKLAENKSISTHLVGGNKINQDTSNYRLIDKTTVIIEEPELNLHPKLQSKLADLFLDVHERFNIDFLIETHSEYLIRRSQVIVAENELEVSPNENPFCVHYFPKDIHQLPYRLEYQEDGTFIKNFGDGFFDVAASSTLDLLRLKRINKS